MYYAKIGEPALADYYIQQARSIDSSNPDLIYNEVVVLVLANQPTQAIKTLRLAFEKGISARQAKLDPELKSLQGRPDFQQLVAEYLNKSG